MTYALDRRRKNRGASSVSDVAETAAAEAAVSIVITAIPEPKEALTMNEERDTVESDVRAAKVEMFNAFARVADKFIELLDLAADHIKRDAARSDARRKPS